MAWYKHTPTDLNWFFRGTQSAIFFYVSCTPCFMYAAKKKQQKENKRAMAERVEEMRTAEGMFYPQPLPFQTNEAWRSEIELGSERPVPETVANVSKASVSGTSSPNRPSTKGLEEKPRPPSSGMIGSRKDVDPAPKKSSARKQEVKDQLPVTPDPKEKRDGGGSASKSRDGAAEDTPSTAISRGRRSGPGSSSGGGGSLGSTTVAYDSTDHGGEGASVTSEEGGSVKKRRYQRPVEPLWGITDGFGPLERLHGYIEPEPVPAWYVQRNPEVNDLHPPVVGSMPKSKKEALWMLQPPPPAAFMEGRIKDSKMMPRSRATTTRTRSTSHGTYLNSSPPAKHQRAKARRRRTSPHGPESSLEELPRRKRRPKALSTIASDGM